MTTSGRSAEGVGKPALVTGDILASIVMTGGVVVVAGYLTGGPLLIAVSMVLVVFTMIIPGMVISSVGERVLPDCRSRSEHARRSAALGAVFAGFAGIAHGLFSQSTDSPGVVSIGPVFEPVMGGTPIPFLLLVSAVLLFVTWGWTSAHLSISIGTGILIAVIVFRMEVGSTLLDVTLLALFVVGLCGMILSGFHEVLTEADLLPTNQPSYAEKPSDGGST